jgi:hypothetical protein
MRWPIIRSKLTHFPLMAASLAICVANLWVFVLVGSVIGGDALSGYEEHGRYFLRARGRTTEVSQFVFAYSKWHAISTMISPLVIVAGWLWGRGQNSN